MTDLHNPLSAISEDAFFQPSGIDIESSSSPPNSSQTGQGTYSQMEFTSFGIMDEPPIPQIESPAWEIINLGIEEPLPPQDTVNEL
jgi:hypothetical protein